MVGQYHQPVFCSNGHPCCTYCTTRVSGCPSCRSAGPWSRCLTVERMGSWMLQRGIVRVPTPPPPLPYTPVRDWQTGRVPRNNVGRVQLFRSERRRHPLLQQFRRLASPQIIPTSSTPPLVSLSASSSSSSLSVMGSPWLGGSSLSSPAPSSRDSPEERVER